MSPVVKTPIPIETARRLQTGELHMIGSTSDGEIPRPRLNITCLFKKTILIKPRQQHRPKTIITLAIAPIRDNPRPRLDLKLLAKIRF